MIGLLPALILLMLPGPVGLEARSVPSQVYLYLAALEGESATLLLPGGSKAQSAPWQSQCSAHNARLESAAGGILPARQERDQSPIFLTGTLQPRDGPAILFS